MTVSLRLMTSVPSLLIWPVPRLPLVPPIPTCSVLLFMMLNWAGVSLMPLFASVSFRPLDRLSTPALSLPAPTNV